MTINDAHKKVKEFNGMTITDYMTPSEFVEIVDINWAKCEGKPYLKTLYEKLDKEHERQRQASIDFMMSGLPASVEENNKNIVDKIIHDSTRID